MAPIQANSELSTKPVPFSYAQAAKGLASTSSSKAALTPSTSAKDKSALLPLMSELPAGSRWADEEDDGPKEKDNTSSATTAVDAQSNPSMRSPITQASDYKADGLTSPPSPDFGTASTSTLARDDDVSPAPIGGFESAWENKSQSSAAAEKLPETTDNTSPKGGKKRNNNSRKGEKGKDLEKEKEKDKAWAIHLQEAPPPAVNIWAKRAEELKSKAPAKTIPTSQPAKMNAPAASSRPAEAPVVVKGANSSTNVAEASKGLNGIGENKGSDRPNGRHQADDKSSSRREPRGGPKASDKVEKPPKVAPPPTQDPKAWPTPDIVKEEEHSKAHDNSEKPEKERNDSSTQASTPAPKAKNAWVTMDFTPTVVFNTPISIPGGRRGGRPARGGREAGGRGGASAANGDKGASQASAANGEVSRRNRPDAAPRNSSPGKGAKRASSLDANARRNSKPVNGVKDATKDTVPSTEASSRPKGSVDEDSKEVTNGSHNTFPRQNNTSKPKVGRRGDLPFINGEKRADTDGGVKESDHTAAPRRQSNSAPGDDNDEHRSSNLESAPGHKFPANGGRGGAFGSFQSGERGRRGHPKQLSRNGAHTFHNGIHPFTNGFNGPVQPYNMTRSPPSGYQQESFFGQQPRGDVYPRGPPRNMSLPAETTYRGQLNGFQAPSQLPPLNTFNAGPNMYNYSGNGSLSAIPLSQNGSSYMDTYALIGLVSQQVEYYFSAENLDRDFWFRKHMDGQGFVLFSLVMDFKRLKHMTTDQEIVKYACHSSRNIEHVIGSDGIDRLRLRLGWEKYILPEADRDPSCQNDGPSHTMLPPVPRPVMLDPFTMRQTSLPLPTSPTSAASAPPFRSLNGFAVEPYTPAEAFNGPIMSGVMDAHIGEAAHLQSSPPGTAQELHESQSSEGPDAVYNSKEDSLRHPSFPQEPDSYTDAQVDTLTLIVRNRDTNSSETAVPPAPSRTFSNGSLDGRNIAEEMGPSIQATTAVSTTAVSPLGPTAPQESESRGSLAGKEHLVPSNDQRDSPRIRPSSESLNSLSSTTEVFWLKGKGSPANELPPDTSSELYLTLRARALGSRFPFTNPHISHDMDLLYQFWSHFLIRNFNTQMYHEFRHCAREDIQMFNSDTGHKNIMNYYTGALAHQDPIRYLVAYDYLLLVRSEPRESDRPAFKQLRTFWRDGALNMKSRKRIMDMLDPDLRAELEDRA